MKHCGGYVIYISCNLRREDFIWSSLSSSCSCHFLLCQVQILLKEFWSCHSYSVIILTYLGFLKTGNLCFYPCFWFKRCSLYLMCWLFYHQLALISFFQLFSVIRDIASLCDVSLNRFCVHLLFQISYLSFFFFFPMIQHCLELLCLSYNIWVLSFSI